jgi:ribonuclease E
MARRMLVNAMHPEEIRIALAENDKLLELEVERADQIQLKGNIYKASITRIEPSLQAAFLDIGSNRNGFLQINDINSTYFNDWPPEDDSRSHRPLIQEVLKSRQELIVQVVKDERAAKGATLTTNLSIPGRYLVLMIGSQRGGVSRKILDEGQRVRLKGAVRDLKIPPGMGVIVRTAGINKTSSQLQADLDALLDIWYQVIDQTRDQTTGPALLYKESDLTIRTLRDYLTADIEEILIDDLATYESAKQFVMRIMPPLESRIKFYDLPQPIFSTYHLDQQIEETDHSEVILPSGGSIVINVTEAVVSIDVNSGRSTGQADVEETAFATNKEAAEIIAKQLRLRDLGGLVVIDFIDMNDRRHKQTVERVLRDALGFDKAKIELGRISKFGLLEMSRQRLKASLVSQSHVVCMHCAGRGRVKTAESTALEVLRKIQSTAFAGGVENIKVHMAPAAALLLLNEKRKDLADFEARSQTKISIYADGRLKPEEYQLELVTAKSGETSATSSISRMRSSEPSSQRSSIDQNDRRRPRGRDDRSSYGRNNRSSSSSSSNNNRDRRDGDRNDNPRRNNNYRGRDRNDSRGESQNRPPRNNNRGRNRQGDNDRRMPYGERGQRFDNQRPREEGERREAAPQENQEAKKE